jgi:hypothetical protein
MADELSIEKMVKQIRTIEKSASELKNLSGGIEAVDRNVDRILASAKMLEINIGDVAEILVDKKTLR